MGEKVRIEDIIKEIEERKKREMEMMKRWAEAIGYAEK